ncbi:MAG: 1-phosphofructokinase family hexose kinase [Rhodospirillales bacterium]|nr:1-phosphofructokinase family hexose kinase [Rhodospirillales bacterium]
MTNIVTLTLNSSVDVQWDVDEVVPIQKLRSSAPLHFPGGGGINVSRVIRILGGNSIAIHTAGGHTGQQFRGLVEAQGLLTRTIPIQGTTRSSATVFERSTSQEFRVTPPGPVMSEHEWNSFLDAAFEYATDYIVATGSLPIGVPNDFYARVARVAREKGVRVVLDTAGRALFEALKEGVYMVKPNLNELERLAGRRAETDQDQETLCRELIARRGAEIVALTLGADGALLVTPDQSLRLKAPTVDVKSAVGAGDSFVAGLTWGLASGRSSADAFRLAVATGTATVMTAGGELCRRADVDRFYEEITRT